jgi:hypothetical protein
VTALGYAEQRDGEVRLSRAEDGSALDGRSRLDAALLSRLDFDVHILEIPPIAEQEIEGLIRFRLRSIYPGNPQETSFDYRVARSGRTRRAVVFICQRKVLEKYRIAAGQTPLTLPYTLIARLARNRGDLCVWCCRGDWTELTVFSGGLPVSSSVQKRTDGEPFDPARAAQGLPDELRVLPAVVVAETAELASLRERFAKEPTHGLSLLSFSQLAAGAGKADGLFAARRRTPAVFSPPARIAALAAAAVVLSVLVFFKYVAAVENRYAAMKRRHASLEQEGRRVIAAEKETEDLRAELSRMAAREPEDLYALFSELSLVLGGDTQILNITVRERTFQVDALGENPLKLMEGFRARPAFTDVRLAQVVPDSLSGKERFSFSGGFDAR